MKAIIHALLFVGALAGIDAMLVVDDTWQCGTDTECVLECQQRFATESMLPPDHPDYVECV